MLFFLAILALAVVSLLLVRAMDIEAVNQPKPPRAPRPKVERLPASALLDGASLRGLY